MKVILITMYAEAILARTTLEDGACGFVLKNLASSELPDAIRAVLAGNKYVSPTLGGKRAGALIHQRGRAAANASAAETRAREMAARQTSRRK